MRRDARGAVTPLTLMAILALTGLALGLSVIGGAVATQRRVESAADLAALAAADAVQSGGDACVTAADIASRNGSVLDTCELDGAFVSVELHRDTPPMLGKVLVTHARARAGPQVTST